MSTETTEVIKLKIQLMKDQRIEIMRGVHALEDELRRRENEGLIGTYWKYRNCESCPETEDDYWWIYARVDALDSDGGVVISRIEIDKRGQLRVHPRDQHNSLKLCGWVPATKTEWKLRIGAAAKLLLGIEPIQVARKRKRR